MAWIGVRRSTLTFVWQLAVFLASGKSRRGRHDEVLVKKTKKKKLKKNYFPQEESCANQGSCFDIDKLGEKLPLDAQQQPLKTVGVAEGQGRG